MLTEAGSNFCQTLNKSLQNRLRLIKYCQKWRNFAKSGHTEQITIKLKMANLSFRWKLFSGLFPILIWALFAPSICDWKTCFSKVGQPRPLFCLFSHFSNTILQKNCRLSGIGTRIVGVEGEHADHLTTNTAPQAVDYFVHKNFSLLRSKTKCLVVWCTFKTIQL